MIDRPGSREDWARIRGICCDTGKSGAPIEEARRPFFAENWVGPYQSMLPHWAYVFRDPETLEIQGYLTGCPDTAQYGRQKNTKFLPKLVARVLSRRYPWNADTRRFLKRSFRLERGPEKAFTNKFNRDLERDYPAHLHVNLDEKARGKGAGRALLLAFEADLRARGIPGLHVHCGEKPLPFYLKTGFKEAARLEFSPGVWIYVLVRKVM